MSRIALVAATVIAHASAAEAQPVIEPRPWSPPPPPVVQPAPAPPVVEPGPPIVQPAPPPPVVQPGPPIVQPGPPLLPPAPPVIEARAPVVEAPPTVAPPPATPRDSVSRKELIQGSVLFGLTWGGAVLIGSVAGPNDSAAYWLILPLAGPVVWSAETDCDWKDCREGLITLGVGWGLVQLGSLIVMIAGFTERSASQQTVRVGPMIGSVQGLEVRGNL